MERGGEVGMTKIENVLKELRWLQFNFPWQDNPENDADKMCNAIHKYTGDAIELLETQQWISVKDRLPEHNQIVLAWECAGFAYVDKYDGEHDVFKIALNNGGTVTHWQSLLEPPKEEA